MWGRDQKVHVDFPNFVQGLGFAGREPISKTMEFSKTHQGRFCQG